jgi:hypothetical protein
MRRRSLLLELKFNDLGGFLRSRLESPVLDGIKAGLNEQRMTTDGTGILYAAIWSDNDLNLDLAGQIHAASQIGELRIHSGFNLAPSSIVDCCADTKETARTAVEATAANLPHANLMDTTPS